jgi:hypothetical protein
MIKTKFSRVFVAVFMVFLLEHISCNAGECNICNILSNLPQSTQKPESTTKFKVSQEQIIGNQFENINSCLNVNTENEKLAAKIEALQHLSVEHSVEMKNLKECSTANKKLTAEVEALQHLSVEHSVEIKNLKEGSTVNKKLALEHSVEIKNLKECCKELTNTLNAHIQWTEGHVDSKLVEKVQKNFDLILEHMNWHMKIGLTG